MMLCYIFIFLNVLLKSVINGGHGRHGDASSGLLAYKDIVVCIFDMFLSLTCTANEIVSQYCMNKSVTVHSLSAYKI